jgi:co-chaperonin GroES (HSP10)
MFSPHSGFIVHNSLGKYARPIDNRFQVQASQFATGQGLLTPESANSVPEKAEVVYIHSNLLFKI